ncbi:hypothetical protein Vretimale_3320 [Volvox reticuliferus]|nr:hypothetical protein Vretimale_3320 [Volvox reticuliferus]
MDLLAAGYGSDSEKDNEVAREEVVPKPAAVIASRRQTSEVSDDDTAESSDESIDSAELRAAEAAARLKDFGEVAISGRSFQQQLVQGGSRQRKQQAVKSLLPSALDVLDQVEGPPTFLDPEAIRPLATSELHGLSDEQAALLGGPNSRGTGGRGGRQQPGKDFDISRLAPPLKGQAK